ncbi:Uncharacterised protein [Vibrio cholerae]|nr:Uncharacterised protein [Vibrio cholerae]
MRIGRIRQRVVNRFRRASGRTGSDALTQVRVNLNPMPCLL